MIVWFRFQT